MKVKLSSFFSLSKSDFVKGLIMAVGGSIFGLIRGMVESESSRG